MKSTLAGYANPNQEKNHAPVDVIADLEKAAEKPIVSEFLARQLGYSLYKLPENTGREEMDWNLHFRLIVKETSDVFLSTSDALQDGNISTLEARNICIEIEEALAVFVTFKKALEEKHFHTENEASALRA